MENSLQRETINQTYWSCIKSTSYPKLRPWPITHELIHAIKRLSLNIHFQFIVYLSRVYIFDICDTKIRIAKEAVSLRDQEISQNRPLGWSTDAVPIREHVCHVQEEFWCFGQMGAWIRLEKLCFNYTKIIYSNIYPKFISLGRSNILFPVEKLIKHLDSFIKYSV